MLPNEILTYTSEAGSVVFASTPTAAYKINEDGVTGLDGAKNELFSEKISGQDGVIPSGDALTARSITLSGLLNGCDQDALNLRLQQVLNPTLPGVLTYDNGLRQRRIEVRVEQAPRVPRRVLRKFFISLIAHDPYFYDAHGETRTDIATWLPMWEWIVPESDRFEYEIRSEAQIVNVFNRGDVAIGLRAEIRANDTVVNPEVMHMGTREYIRINKTMQAGDVIEVDTRRNNKSIWFTPAGGTRQRAFHLKAPGMSFFALAARDNPIRYWAEAGHENMVVTLFASSRYVSA